SSLLVALVINPVFTSRFMKMDRRAEDSRRRMKNRKGILFFALGCVVVAVLMHFMSVTWARNLLAIAALITLLNFFLLRPGSFYFQERVMPALERGYHNFIKRALYRRMPAWVLAGTFGLLIFSVVALTLNMPKVIFFPSADPLYINVFVELPRGRAVKSTARPVGSTEGRPSEALIARVERV